MESSVYRRVPLSSELNTRKLVMKIKLCTSFQLLSFKSFVCFGMPGEENLYRDDGLACVGSLVV